MATAPFPNVIGHITWRMSLFASRQPIRSLDRGRRSGSRELLAGLRLSPTASGGSLIVSVRAVRVPVAEPLVLQTHAASTSMVLGMRKHK